MNLTRRKIYDKTRGHCAYCGVKLDQSTWHIDHVAAIYRDRSDIGGNDDFDNKLPACKRCNLWKKTYSVEQFRKEISMQYGRLLRDSASFRLAHDFGLVTQNNADVVFYFELHNAELS